jgi:hypothetical protein
LTYTNTTILSQLPNLIDCNIYVKYIKDCKYLVANELFNGKELKAKRTVIFLDLFRSNAVKLWLAACY